MTELKWNVRKVSLKRAGALMMALCLLALPAAGNVSAADLGAKAPKAAAGERVRTPEEGQSPEDGKVAVTAVRLDKTSVSLKVKEAVTLKATVSPENATDSAVTWSSSNDKIAKVDQKGNVTAVAKGTATITARAGGKEAVCKVTVVAVTLKADQATIQVGKKASIKVASTYPKNDAVSYTSSDKKIASVDKKGVVTGKKAGRATITVKTESGAQAAFKVKVVKKASVVLSPKTKVLAVKQSTKIKVDAARSTSVNIKTCESSNKDVASVNNKGVVRAKKVGNATITVTMKDGAKAKFKVVVKKAVVKLTKKQGTVKVGKKTTITVDKAGTIPVNDKIKKCTIDKKNIASVNNKGVVTGKKAGKATVTVTMGSGARAEFKVTVKK